MTTTLLESMTPVQWHQKQLAALKLERESWENHWRELQEYLLPRRGRFNMDKRNKGDKVNQSIIDSTGTHALRIQTAGFASGVTNPARRWARFVPPDPEMRAFGPVNDWLELAERLMYDIFRDANFYDVMPQVYEELGGFGTACAWSQRNFDSVLRFGAFTIGEYYIANDMMGEVRVVYRELPMTVKQLVDKYGDKRAGPNTRWNNFSTHVRTLYEQGNYHEWIDTVHAFHENPNFVPGSTLSRELPWEQFVWEYTGDKGDAQPQQQPLRRMGHRRYPIKTVRWDLRTPDVYGRSPGMDALGDIKQLQEQHKRKGQALAKHVNPPMLASAAMKKERITTLPGDTTFVGEPDTSNGFRPAYQVQPRLNDFVLDMEDTRQRIRKAFHSDLFLSITERPGIQPLNESEIFERKEEKLLALGPVMERVDQDLLGPIIDDVFAEMVENDLLPPPPPELEGAELTVEYLNIIAIAQRAQGLLGIQDTAGFVGQLASAQAASGQEVTAWDRFDIDAAIEEYGDKRGVPAAIIRDKDEADAMRAERRQQQQAMQAMAAAEQLSQSAKNLGDIETTRGNLVADYGQAAGVL